MKYCTHPNCKLKDELQPLENFKKYIDKRAKNKSYHKEKISNWCKKCFIVEELKRYKNKKKEILEYKSEYYKKNYDKIKKYKNDNKEKYKIKNKEYRNKLNIYNEQIIKNLNFAEEINIKNNLIQVKCKYCNSWFYPTQNQIKKRLDVLLDKISVGNNYFYCSNNCKKACPTFKRIKYPLGYKKNSSREVNPEFRKMVFERDDWTCQKCGKTKEKDSIILHCHHIEGKTLNPMIDNDIDNGITLCKECHIFIHTQTSIACKYNNLKCK